MRVFFDKVEKDKRQWAIYWHDADQESPQQRALVLPLDTIEWRAAEYNIPPDRLDDLIDLLFCEQFVSQEFYDSDVGLFNAPDIETARTAYLAEIAKIKWALRVSTRGSDHPLNHLRSETNFDAGSMAYKGMTVLLNRHVEGSQTLDPAVRAVLMNFAHAHPNAKREA